MLLGILIKTIIDVENFRIVCTAMEEWWVMSFAFMKVNNDWHTKSLPGCDSWRRGVCPAWWASPTRRRAPPRASSPRAEKTRSVRPLAWPRMRCWTWCCPPAQSHLVTVCHLSPALTCRGTVSRPEAMSLSSWFLSPLRNSTSQPSQRSTTFLSLVQTCSTLAWRSTMSFHQVLLGRPRKVSSKFW